MKASHGLLPVFDDPNVVSHAGLVPVRELAERVGLSALIEECSTLPVANTAVKARTVLGGMLAGADAMLVGAEAQVRLAVTAAHRARPVGVVIARSDSIRLQGGSSPVLDLPLGFHL